MTGLDVDDLEALARLARLTVVDHDRATLVRQLGEIVGYLDALAAVDVEGVAPWEPSAPGAAPLRADVAGEALPVELVLAGAPSADDGLVLVPRFVES
jgi:aspartyl-tRNA(Asn)/glutamyl-tRNA(Gln) amidotransferase subunit C